MQIDEYEIVRYRPEFKEQVIRLQTQLWGEDLSQNFAYFEWKYERNPYNQEPIIYLAIYNGQVVAMRGFIGSRWQAGNPTQIANCLLLSDSVTHLDHRRKGLFTKITEKALDDVKDGPFDYIFNLSSGPLSTAANLKLGWVNLAPNLVGTCFPGFTLKEPRGIKKYLRNIRLLYELYQLAKKKVKRRSKPSVEQRSLTKLPSTQFQQLDTYFAGSESPTNLATKKTNLNIWMKKQPEASQMIELIQRTSFDGKVRHVRDEEFFDWRYDNPRAGYRFLFSGGEQLDAYLVLRESLYPKSTEVKIVDWEASNVQAFGNLIRTAVLHGKFDAVTIWATTLTHTEKQVLQDLHFSFAYEKGGEDADSARPCVLIKSLRSSETSSWAVGGQGLWNLGLWDIRSIYSDGY